MLVEAEVVSLSSAATQDSAIPVVVAVQSLFPISDCSSLVRAELQTDLHPSHLLRYCYSEKRE